MTTKKKFLSGVGVLLLFLIIQSQIKSCIRNSEKEEEKAELARKDAFVPKMTKYKLIANELKISGPLGKYLKISKSDAEFNFVKTSKGFMDKEHMQNWELKVKCERLPVKLEWDIDKLNGNYTHLILNVIDEHGSPVRNGEIQCRSGHDLIDKVLSLNFKEEGWVTFETKVGKAYEEDVLKNWKKFTVSSEARESKPIQETSSSASNDVVSEFSTGEGDERWDEMLDDYEEYMDSYVKLLKKSQAGDMSALTEYPKILAKATEFQKSLEKAKGELSLTQINRMNKINMKMLNAMQ